MSAPLSLLVEDVGHHVRREEFHDFPVLIGRDEQAGLRLEGPRVSRRHARIALGEDGLEIEDLGSSNGTLLDGTTLSRAPLRPGARITIGDSVLTVLGDSTGPFAPQEASSVRPVAPAAPLAAGEAPPQRRAASDPRRWSPRAKFMSAALTVLVFGVAHVAMLVSYQQCSSPPRPAETEPDADQASPLGAPIAPAPRADGTGDRGGQPRAGTTEDPLPEGDRPIPERVRALLVAGRHREAAALVDAAAEGSPEERSALGQEVQAAWRAATEARAAEVRRRLAAGDAALAREALEAMRGTVAPGLAAGFASLERAVALAEEALAEPARMEARPARPAPEGEALRAALREPRSRVLRRAVLAQAGSEAGDASGRRILEAFESAARDLGRRLAESRPLGVELRLTSGERRAVHGLSEIDGEDCLLGPGGEVLARLPDLPWSSMLQVLEPLPGTLDRHLVRAWAHREAGEPAEEWFDLHGALRGPDLAPELRARIEARLQELHRQLAPR